MSGWNACALLARHVGWRVVRYVERVASPCFIAEHEFHARQRRR